MSKLKGGLGKGLSALIRPAAQPERPIAASTETVSVRSEGEICHVELSKVKPNPYQPRADFDQQALDELKHSIKQKGIIQPITVRRKTDGEFELISGERRVRASLELGLKTIPAYIIVVKNDEEMLELALVENLQREHLNPIEIAISYQRLLHDVGLTAEDVAKKIGKDRTTVVNFLRLLKLPDKVQQSLRKGMLTVGHARALLSLPDEPIQLRVFDRILKKDLNVRQVEKIVRNYGKSKQAKVISLNQSTRNAIGNIEERIQHLLGTKVKIVTKENGMGEIIIEYYSPDDLGRLFDLLATIEQ